MSDVALAVIHYDPADALFDQMVRMLPRLQQVFADIAVFANAATASRSIDYLRQQGTRVVADSEQVGLNHVGALRRSAVQLALRGSSPIILYCDFDRSLHWMEFHPQELRDVVQRLSDYDFTVLGRTPRAFATHPRIQRDTEAIINHVFERVSALTSSGRAWDTGAGARGLSRRAAEAIVDGCHDDGISNDVTWPLCLQQMGGFTLGTIETEGLEFETPDRFPAEVAQAGGVAHWSERLDDDPQHWATRLELARIEVAAMLPYARS